MTTSTTPATTSQKLLTHHNPTDPLVLSRTNEALTFHKIHYCLYLAACSNNNYNKIAQETYNEIIIRNQNLVHQQAHKFQPYTDHQDYVSEGNLGLIKAVQKFNVSYGWKFSTYSSYAIYRQILLAHRKHGRYYEGHKTLFNGTLYVNHIFDETEAKENTTRFYSAINTLSAKNQLILKHHYNLGGHSHKTLQELGKMFDRSKAAILKNEQDAIKKLKQLLTS